MPPTRRDLSLALALAAVLPVAGCGRSEAAIRQSASGVGNVRPDLYACEGCEAVAERSPETLGSILRLGDGGTPVERLRLEGRVVRADGTTPAAGVVLYIHHTNAEGLYADGAPDTVWSRRHGRLRGWVRTDAGGRYRIETIKPAPYPSRTMPAHIHMFVGEEGRRPYYVDDVVFDGEFGVDAAYLARQERRGGSGVVRLTVLEGGLLVARRDLRLERHPA